jgi:hypothetical protein
MLTTDVALAGGWLAAGEDALPRVAIEVTVPLSPSGEPTTITG